MEKILQDLIELKKEEKEKLENIIDGFCARNHEEKHVEVLLFKYRVGWQKRIILHLDCIIYKYTKL